MNVLPIMQNMPFLLKRCISRVEQAPFIINENKPRKPKYWKVAGSSGDRSLKNSAKSGTESVYITDILTLPSTLSESPNGKCQSDILKNVQPR